MGWSCSMEADITLRELQKRMNYKGLSNAWNIENRIFCFEIGKEQADGSITGTISELFEREPRQFSEIRKGSFKIGSNGNIIRFPFMPK